MSDWQTLMTSITSFLSNQNMTWNHICSQATRPQHLGWSRLVCNGTKARFFYKLLQQYEMPRTRNSNERDWSNMGIDHMTEARWDSVYRNFSRLKTNFRVKFQEFRIIWARQELLKYRLQYCQEGEGNDPHCSLTVKTLL